MIDLPPLDFPKPAIIRPSTADLLQYGGPALGMLPGAPAMIAAGKKDLPVITEQTLYEPGNLSSTSTITKPPGTVEGDLLVAVIGGQRIASTPFPITPPAGWTELFSPFQSGTSAGHTATFGHWKVAGSSEPSNYTWTTNNNLARNGFILQIRGANPSLIASSSNSGTTSTITASSITGGVNHLLIFVGVASASGTTLAMPSGMENIALLSNIITSAVRSFMRIAQETLTEAGSTGSRTASHDFNTWTGNLIGIAPA